MCSAPSGLKARTPFFSDVFSSNAAGPREPLSQPSPSAFVLLPNCCAPTSPRGKYSPSSPPPPEGELAADLMVLQLGAGGMIKLRPASLSAAACCGRILSTMSGCPERVGNGDLWATRAHSGAP
eukprot:CAMPEP_0182847562 /NCGR_PEP_ID=MMETSP0006_2-20121128/28525_1 /TAXON_ID=97485 /ORGANISM="Prymnesium parvum, Strain Texoma1" /LENGTH=123 /DNA_ID=CAMNT_0024977905 /DNA_START=969 /DNA_END=1337 /DNA_ORIENTATION=+